MGPLEKCRADARGWVAPKPLCAFLTMIGMVLTIPKGRLREAQAVLSRLGEKHYTIGQVVRGAHQVSYTCK